MLWPCYYYIHASLYTILYAIFFVAVVYVHSIAMHILYRSNMREISKSLERYTDGIFCM